MEDKTYSKQIDKILKWDCVQKEMCKNYMKKTLKQFYKTQKQIRANKKAFLVFEYNLES